MHNANSEPPAMFSVKDAPVFISGLLVVLVVIVGLGAALQALGWPWWANLLALLLVINGVPMAMGWLADQAGAGRIFFGRGGPADLRDDIDTLVQQWLRGFSGTDDRAGGLADLVERAADYADEVALSDRARGHLVHHLAESLADYGLAEDEVAIVRRQLHIRLGL